MTKSDKMGGSPSMSGRQGANASPAGANASDSEFLAKPNTIAGKPSVSESPKNEGDVEAAAPMSEKQPSPSKENRPDNNFKKSRARKRRRKRGNTGDSQNRPLDETAAKQACAATPTDRTPKKHYSQTAYAALDLGTNNCRLLVAVPTRPGQFRVIDAFSRIVRLGEGLGASSRLSQAAMDRSVEALKVCRDKLHSRPIERVRLIATEACRQAENGEEFLERVKHEAGLKLEIVDRETEARLAVSGCSSLVDRSAKSIILFDIGGGSSEIALVNAADHKGGRLSNHIQAWTSLPVGVVTMAEKFGGGHDVTPQRFEEMIGYATDLLRQHGGDELMASAHGGSASVVGDDFHLIGTSGTVTTLAGIHLNLPRYDRRRVDGLWMSSPQVDAINQKLLDWSFDERAANACIGADRADLVLAGCAILEAIRKVWPSERLRVADRGLREGILTEMMASDGAWRRKHRSNNYRGRTRRGNSQ